MSDFRFPEFDDLPTVQGQPKGCLWGFFDVDGEKDQLGTLRLLTEEVVRKAKDEIQTGVRVQLDWPLHNVEYPGFGRIPLQHDIKDLAEEGYVGFDDVITLNTQSSSQWDGLKHWGSQKSSLYYNGWTHAQLKASNNLGIHNWCDNGGIAGRAVLIDWLSWWEHHNPGLEAPSPITCHKIPVSELEAALAFQGTELKQGDILIVRSGFVRWHNNAEASVRSLGTKERQYVIGLANNEETVKWLYSKHFSAVAGDTMGFEAWPFPEGCCLHEWLLVQWGTPIGELWDLESLAEQCKTHKRWSFFLTSAPLRLVGGVASPPNAVAMF
ncbi:hypothetical protein FOQG_13133 [Fusarium oxysporum f. sp. raphani 54005]|uniref:Cyclase n=1 Tax=Fusarium oxysporum f. sp. raphani 54005 TaxID=1089458 RepID=X0BK74_FUSOX|nr:hypothetical protein FOQG_13133 [Fusarium oxysporum f. sp. raphani 54005]